MPDDMRRGRLDRHGRRHQPGCYFFGQWRDGFHTTAARFVPSIMEHGLIPYPLGKPHLPERGVWVWLGEARDEFDELGVAVQRMLDHETFEVVMLAARWPRCAEWGGCLQEFRVGHEGHLSGNKGNVWQYHDDREARIVLERIPPENIAVHRTYDLRAML